MREWVKSPYMAWRRGMPMTRVLGRVAREKRVMSHSREPLAKKRVQSERRRSTRSLESVSAMMNLVFIWYGLFIEMKWKESTGMAKTATNRFMPEHCSGLNILHHFTEPYATSIAKYKGTMAHITLYKSSPVIITDL